MAYEKTNWVNNDEPPISAANLQNVEDGIEHNDIRLNNLDNIMSLTPNSWVANQEYTIHDIVVYNGMLYENITGNNSDTTPDSDVNNWSETKLLEQNSDGLVKINNKLTSKNNQFEQITKTGRKVNGKDEYIYYGIIDSLPNASNATYPTPVLMSDIEFVTGFGGTAYRESNDSWFQFNCFRQSFSDGIGVQGTVENGYMAFYVQTGNDRRSLKGYPWFTFTYKNN